MSLKGDKYENIDEIRMRLENTIVLYDKKPVFITNVMPPSGDDKEIARVFFTPIPQKANGKVERKYLSSRNFDLSPFKMGYMNFNGKVIKLSRNPVRQNRQGLSYGTTTMTDVCGTRIDPVWHDVLASQGFYDMVMGVYPGFGAIKDLSVKNSSVALSREFAAVFDDDLDVAFLANNGTKCGLIDKAGVRLSKKHAFLKETLEELKIPLL